MIHEGFRRSHVTPQRYPQACFTEAVTSIRVATTIEATTERVWAAVEDIASHTRWMDDAGPQPVLKVAV